MYARADGRGVAPQQPDEWSQDTATGPSTAQRPLYTSNSQQSSLSAFQAKPPTEEEQPIQTEALYQTRSITFGAGSRGSAAKAVCKAAGGGKEHSRLDAMRRHKTRAHVMSTRQKRAVSESPRPPADVNTMQESHRLVAIQT